MQKIALIGAGFIGCVAAIAYLGQKREIACFWITIQRSKAKNYLIFQLFPWKNTLIIMKAHVI